MAVQPIESGHPVVAALQACEAALDGAAEFDPLYMSAADKEAALLVKERVDAKLAALGLRIVAVADDVADRHGARDPAAWLSHATRCNPGAARAQQQLAKELERFERVAAGMAAGKVSVPQAKVIIQALQALPADLDLATSARAEAHLVALAEHYNPSQLKRLGRHLLAVVAPDIADAEEGRRLEEEERKAAETCRLEFASRGDGTTAVHGVLPDAAAARLRTYLEAFTSPRKTPGGYSEVDQVPHRVRLGQAFCALLEHLNPTKLPTHGGTATTVMVTITLDQLRADLATAGLIDGHLDLGPNLSASEARRLACTGQIIPVVLGGDSEILDLGRAKRLFSVPQIKAMRLRDKQCKAEGCTIPAAWCEAHHVNPWSQGGNTDLKHGVLYCSFHHHRAHDTRYHLHRLPNGDHRFTRRT